MYDIILRILILLWAAPIVLIGTSGILALLGYIWYQSMRILFFIVTGQFHAL